MRRRLHPGRKAGPTGGAAPAGALSTSAGATLRPKRLQPERALKKAVLDLIAWNYKGRILAIDNDRGLTLRNRYLREGTVGSPDIVGVLKGGRWFSLELKTPKGRLSDHQERYADALWNIGAFHAVVRTFEEASLTLARWLALAGPESRSGRILNAFKSYDESARPQKPASAKSPKVDTRNVRCAGCGHYKSHHSREAGCAHGGRKVGLCLCEVFTLPELAGHAFGGGPLRK